MQSPWRLDVGDKGRLEGPGLLVEVNMHRIKDPMELVPVDSTLYVLGDGGILQRGKEALGGAILLLLK